MKNEVNFPELDKKIDHAYRQYRGWWSSDKERSDRWYAVYEWFLSKKNKRLAQIFGS